MDNRATEAMLASASPRKPNVAMRSKSAVASILLVAKRLTAKRKSSASMPQPSSRTTMRFTPPPSMETVMAPASASRLFSKSSFTMDAGRSTTSPAAIWLATNSGSLRMRGMGRQEPRGITSTCPTRMVSPVRPLAARNMPADTR